MTPVPQFAPPLAAPAVPDPYPDSDGLPMAENTLQFDWIVKIKENLEIRFADDPEVFVAGDLLWYPVPDGGRTCPLAPDTLVAFGRPKGRRGSYKQWEEGGIPPQVVFEILSPSNTPKELRAKREFYDRHGVEEYYVYDPDRNRLEIWRRGAAGVLERLSPVKGWISPRLGIRFALGGQTLELFHPDGTPFRSPVELARLAEQERRQAALDRRRATEADRQAALERQRVAKADRQAVLERQRAAAADRQADLERQQAALERQRATEADRLADLERQRATEADRQVALERQRADLERQRAERLAARLRALGIDPEAPA